MFKLNQEIKELNEHLNNYHFIEKSLVKKLENLSKRENERMESTIEKIRRTIQC